MRFVFVLKAESCFKLATKCSRKVKRSRTVLNRIVKYVNVKYNFVEIVNVSNFIVGLSLNLSFVC